MTPAPFRQLPFDEVPELPRLPHRWAETTVRDLVITTPDLGQTRITVREYGTGTPLLLVHGMGTAGYSFRYLLELLGSRYRLLIPDLPGAGHSDYPDVYLGPDVMADAILAIIDGLGIRGCAVIGNSMGGYLCMRAVLRDSRAPSGERAIARLVNLHSPGVPTARMTALRWAMRLLPSWTIVERLLRKDPERWIHNNVHYYDESLKSREEHREFSVPLRERAGRRTYYRHLRDTLDAGEMKKFVAALRATTFPIPLLLVYAKTDPMVPPIVGVRLRKLVPDAGFIELAEASHFAHVDAAARFAEAVTPFLT